MNRQFRRSLFASALAFSLIAAPAWSAEYSVGSDAACDYDDLDDAISAASAGDTLRLKSETFTDLITVDRTLTLIGGHTFCGDDSPSFGATTVIANPPFGATPVVTVTGTQVNMSQITVQGANSATDGGGIYVGSFSGLELRQVVVKENEGANGGGIYVDSNARLATSSGNLVLSIINNSTPGVGGGIYAGSGATIDLAGSIVDISGNTAENSGGGLFTSGNADIALTGATVADNTSNTSLGGGLYSGQGVSNVVIDIIDSTFENNAADQSSGGGLYIYGNSGADKQLNITNSEFLSNTADSDGGAMTLRGELTTDITNSLFDGNSAGRDGGGIHCEVTNAMVTIDQSTISNNTASRNGGGLWLAPGNVHFTGDFGSRTHIEDNSATQGGGLFVSGPGGGIPQFINVYFNSYTRVFSNTADEGAGIFLDDSGGHFLQFNGQANQNQATGDGGAFALRGTGRISLSGASIGQNSASGNGGGIHATAGEVTARNYSGIFGNGALDGAGLYLQDAALSYDDSYLSINNADSDGGAIHASGTGDIELINATLRANSAAGRGGGIFRSGSGRLSMTANMVADSVTPRGASECDPSTLDANRYCSEVIDNTASIGGGIHIAAGSQEIEPHRIEHTAFLNNSGDLGSALTLIDAFDVWVDVSLFSGNTDDGDDEIAGVIHVDGSSEIALDSSTIAGNSETGLVVLSDAGTVHNIYRNILWDNSGDFIEAPDIVVDNQCNMSQDNSLPGAPGQPAFITSVRGDHRLSQDSDAIDFNCNVSGGTDLDGITRPIGSHNDLGAFEGARSDAGSIFSDRFQN